MANLIIDLPDDLARTLEGIAAAQHKTVQQLAVEQLRSIVEVSWEPLAGSAAAILNAMRQPPQLSAPDIDELDAVIASGRSPVHVPSSDCTNRK